MRRIAPLRPPQQIPAFAIGGHAAAGAVNESDGAVDFRIVVEHAGAIDLLGDEFCRRGRAIHRGENADIIARAGLAVRPHITLKRRALLRRQHLVVLCRLRETILAREIVHLDVMLVHPIAGRDRFCGKADDLAVFPHRRAFGDGSHGHLVAARDALARGQAGSLGVGGDLIDGDDDIVIGRKADGSRRVHATALVMTRLATRRRQRAWTTSVVAIGNIGKPPGRAMRRCVPGVQTNTLGADVRSNGRRLAERRMPHFVAKHSVGRGFCR